MFGPEGLILGADALQGRQTVPLGQQLEEVDELRFGVAEERVLSDRDR